MNWPHAPPHWLFDRGFYMVTAATYHKAPHFRGDARLEFLLNLFLQLACEFAWEPKAWAFFSNHYHFVARSPSDPSTLRKLLSKLHTLSAKTVNELDAAQGRRVWFQFWDSQITYEKSYLARLKYVNENPVRHGVTTRAEEYPWCSAAWFSQNASPVFVKTVESFKIDQLNVIDDF